MRDEECLQMILEAPDDEAPRLRYAAWLKEKADPRGEFMQLQCEKAQKTGYEPWLSIQNTRECVLLEANHRKWAGEIAELVDVYDFWRGFVAAVSLDATDFLRKAPRIFALAPIQHVEFSFGGTEHARHVLRALEASEYIRRLKTVELAFGCYEATDNELRLIAALPEIATRMRRISLTEGRVTADGLRAIVMSPHVRLLRGISLCECELEGEQGIRPLGESPHLSSLADLALDGNTLADDGARALAACAQLKGLANLSLRDCDIGDAGVCALAQSPHLGGLRAVFLAKNRISDRGARALGESSTLSKLECLDVAGNPIGDAWAHALQARTQKSTQPLTASLALWLSIERLANLSDSLAKQFKRPLPPGVS